MDAQPSAGMHGNLGLGAVPVVKGRIDKIGHSRNESRTVTRSLESSCFLLVAAATCKVYGLSRQDIKRSNFLPTEANPSSQAPYCFGQFHRSSVEASR